MSIFLFQSYWTKNLAAAFAVWGATWARRRSRTWAKRSRRTWPDQEVLLCGEGHLPHPGVQGRQKKVLILQSNTKITFNDTILIFLKI